MPETTEEVHVEVDGRTLKLSNLSKVLYPLTGTTKGEVLNYYARIAPVLLPHLAHRAVTRIRWPHGTSDMQFFEKNVPNGVPSWIRTVTVPSTGSRGGGDKIVFPVVEGLADLTYFVNLASLELHVHQWTVGRNGQRKNPNRMVIDLDPGAPAGLQECCRVALLVRDKLEERGLSAVPVTSGSKGLHMYAALPGRRNADQVRDDAQEIARELTREHPDLVLWKMTKSLRPGKVFLDWSQNTGAKTTISPYSLRGRERPYVAAPRTWEEIEEGAEEGLGQLEVDDVLARADELGDIFGDELGSAG
ncbi:MAG: bifunctional non-ous end joining protein LigD [Nocardioidaceae bacterium]|jgi:bifunctional non-homologous end joining protein LigD|nr:bifunctional non-ous end joining protein LigD [Nocardioidaceae bacterium]